MPSGNSGTWVPSPQGVGEVLLLEGLVVPEHGRPVDPGLARLDVVSAVATTSVLPLLEES